MKQKYFPSTFIFFLLFTFSITYGQNSDKIWTAINKNSIVQNRVLPQESTPVTAAYFQLDRELLKSALQNVPERHSGMLSNIIIDFPDALGSTHPFRIMEYSLMEAELQAKYPDIRSYIGYSTTDATTVVYFSVSPLGLHAMTTSNPDGTEFINPYTKDGAYEVFSRSALPVAENNFECSVVETGLSRPFDVAIDFEAINNAGDGNRRTFKVAVGTSVEYTNFHGGTLASAMSAINVTMTRVNGIYDKELSIRMVLVAKNDLLVSTTDNSLFSNTGKISLITGIIDGIIGASNYDIGHTFTTGSGGSAYLSSACTESKGGGTTGLPSPIGDPFSIDFVSHEMGHQFGATHTFNGTTGNCSGNHRSSITAYEPGSGSTIMSYAGICSPQNIQNNSDDYFHQASLQQIWNNITQGNSTCGVLTVTGNTAPTADAGASYSIPISTPYRLTGTSSDVDGTDTHTYTWEQFDLGPAGLPTTTTEFGPMVRSVRGSTDPVRYIPNLPDVLDNGGALDPWEKLASIERVLNFALTVRDNDPRGGQTAADDMTVTTIAEGGPFLVTSQSSNVTWEVGANKTVTWDVANTTAAPINTATVNIKLSIDGGVTFPFILAAQVPNDGSHEVVVPAGTITEKARIMVEGVDNIFYNVNTSEFKIVVVDFLLNFSPTSLTVVHPDQAVFDFVYNTYGGFNQSTTFSATNLPSGATASFNPASATADGTKVTMTIKTNGVASGSYDIAATGVSGGITNSSTVHLTIFNSTIAPVTLVSPADGMKGLYRDVTFTWGNDVNVETYLLEVATDGHFKTIVESQNLTTTSYTTNLDLGTHYYWRVTGSNRYATGPASSVFEFSTGIASCDYLFTAADTPIAISSKSSRTYTSTILVSEDLPVTDVKVKVNIPHTRVSDLRLVLISPEGTPVVLANRNGTEFDQNYTNTVFDQTASTSIVSGTSPYTGVFKPLEDLSTISGEMSAGTWSLQVTDDFVANGGSIETFGLELCLAKPLSIEEDSFEQFSIYPNPNHGDFIVKLQSSSQQAIYINVHDLRGRKILERRFENKGYFKENIRLDHASKGLYLIHISDGIKTVTKKIILD